MRIGLFTDTYYPEVNGVANSVMQLKKELENRGNRVYVFTVSNPEVGGKEHHVYRMKSIECPLIKERRVSYASFSHWFPVIKSLHLDVIHTNTEFMVGWIGRKAAAKLGIPLLHTYHTIYEDYTHYLKIPGNEKLKPVIRSLSCACCDHAEAVIAPTDKVKELLVAYGVKKPIVVQPTGILLSKFRLVDWKKVMQIKEKYGIEPGHHVLVSIGRLSQEKNLQEILTFMSRLIAMDDRARLLIVGDGPERKHLEEQAQKQKLSPYIRFTGQVDWKEIQNYYAAGDVFVSASTSETQGLTYIEAMACGKPVLVRKDECLKDVLQNGVNGYCYQTEEEFLEAYRMLFQKEQCRKMSGAVQESVEGLSSEAFGRNVEQIYTKLIDSRKTEGKEWHGQLYSVAE